MQTVGLTAKQERAARVRLERPSASEREVLVAAGYSPATAHNPIQNGIDTRALADKYSRGKLRKITPSEAKHLGLERLAEIVEDENPQYAAVAAKVLVDYGTSAVEDEPELSGNEARAWQRQRALEKRLRTLLAIQRMGTAWLERYLATKMVTTTSSGEAPPQQSTETPASTANVR